MGTLFFAIGIFVEVAAIGVHIFGLYLLTNLFSNGRGNAQYIYIFCLSIIEIMLLATFLSGTTLYVIIELDHFTRVKIYLDLVIYTLVTCVMFLSMFCIVVDKALEVFLNIKYPLYCSQRKAKYAEIAAFLIGVILFGIGVILYDISALKLSYYFAVYVRLIIDAVFLIVTGMSYLYIFYKYIQLKNSENQSAQPTQTDQLSVWKIFRQSRFFISVCLVSTYILFVVIPDYLQVIYKIGKFNGDKMILYGVRIILYTISTLSDAYIYIFLDTKVKRLLYKELHRMGLLRKRDERTSTINRTQRCTFDKETATDETSL